MDDAAYERAYLAKRQFAELQAADQAANPAVKQLHRDFAKRYGKAIDKLSSLELRSN